MKAYENKEPRINLFPVRIRSSSPKLNFFIRTPEPTAIAAAGVDIAIIHDSIFSKAEFKVEINFGYAQKEGCAKTNKIKKNKIKQ